MEIWGIFMMYIIFDLKTLFFFAGYSTVVDSVTHFLGGVESCDVAPCCVVSIAFDHEWSSGNQSSNWLFWAESCGQRWFGGDEEMWWQL